MKTLQIISYYTQDWDYPKYADHLRSDCDRLGILHHVVEKPSTNTYVGNCQIKAFFIRDMLQQFKSPVMWMDADGSICKFPELLAQDYMSEYDMAGNHPIKDPARVHVGSIWFNYTPATIDFVDAWCAGIERKKGIDDAAFNGTWDLLKDKIKFYALPPEYFMILPRNNDKIPPQAVIAHRLSNSSLKQEYKKRVG